MAEFLLYGRTEYSEVLTFAHDLREAGERIGSERAIAFAATVSGEAALLSGDLEAAEARLQEGVDMHHAMGANAGEALSLQRMAETQIELGHLDHALELLERALPLARWSPLSHHLIQRVFGTMIRATTDPHDRRRVVDRAADAIGPSDMCQFCTVMISAPAAIACSDVGDIEEAQAHLMKAERSAMAWQGTAWQGAVAEARAHLQRAQGQTDAAEAAMHEAARLYEQAGQPNDVGRCRRFSATAPALS